MNMYDRLDANHDDLNGDEQSLPMRLWQRVIELRYFFLVVVIPTLILSGYYYLIAADQYESEAHFIVSANGATSASSSGLGTLLGLGGASESQSQMLSVPDYLQSHDAVDGLQKSLDLVAMYRRPEADAFSRLKSPHPAPETLLKYYRGMVNVHSDHDNGITTLKVRAFRPDDAYAIVRNLLVLGEQQVNAMNRRSYKDGIAMAESQLQDAEATVASIQHRMTSYRQDQRDIDPQASGESQIHLVSDLSSRLALARSQLAMMSGLIGKSSPQYVAMARQVQALAAQVASQSSQLTGGQTNNIATSLGGYEDLKVRQDFAAKQYDAAAASLQKAREDAARQQLYLVRVVDANRPVKSLYPERFKIILTAFLGLSLFYGIAWLIIAGVREHAA